jgi:thiol-disulfide isomerase/thioredoxin
MEFYKSRGAQKFRQSIGRLDKSIFLLVFGLLIGVGLGSIFTWLEGTGYVLAEVFSSSLDSAGPPSIGKTALDFELYDLDQKPIRLSHLKGFPVIINFWATWCPPCLQEMPLIEEISTQFPDLIVLAVNADESEATVRAFVQKYQISTLVLLDPGAVVNEFYYVDGLPTSFFVDRNGIIQSVQVGILTEARLAEHLAKIGLQK